ncbi:tripartite tricarboxylate transporter TctB family protein [Niallia oryzisoli]|uniref:Tripartite tricarboxylate transporter TctB family protein n=1 Tax=Niallia oryzisoli TaxID=1737571 RepID=A0ABZ2C720_9BACI
MSKMNAGMWAGTVLLIFSTVFFILSFQFSYLSDAGPGPGFFPIWLSGLLILLSVIYISESYQKRNESEEKWPEKAELINILLLLIALFAFVLLFLLFGFFVACFAFLFVLFFKGYKWYTNLIMSAGITFILYFLFNDLLGVLLPIEGILF